MIPPQCGMLTIGARPITLPERITAMIFASVLNWWRKSAPESGGIVLSGESGFATPPSPFGPWHSEHAKVVKSCAPAATCGSTVTGAAAAAAATGADERVV